MKRGTVIALTVMTMLISLMGCKSKNLQPEPIKEVPPAEDSANGGSAEVAPAEEKSIYRIDNESADLWKTCLDEWNDDCSDLFDEPCDADPSTFVDFECARNSILSCAEKLLSNQVDGNIIINDKPLVEYVFSIEYADKLIPELLKKVKLDDRLKKLILFKAIQNTDINGSLYNYIKVIPELVKAGADVNAVDQNGNTPIFTLLSAINTAQCDQYVPTGPCNGVDCNYMYDSVYKMSYMINALKSLISAGAVVSAKSKDGLSPLEFILKAPGHAHDKYEMAKILIDAKADTDVLKDKTNRLSMVIADPSNREIIPLLLNAGWKVQEEEKSTILVLAAAAGCSATVFEALINAGADVNGVDKDGKTPLMASLLRPFDFDGCLKNEHEPPSKCDIAFCPTKFDANAFKQALDMDVEALVALYKAGAKLPKTVSEPLILFAMAHDTFGSRTEALINAGVEVNVVNKEGKSPIDFLLDMPVVRYFAREYEIDHYGLTCAEVKIPPSFVYYKGCDFHVFDRMNIYNALINAGVKPKKVDEAMLQKAIDAVEFYPQLFTQFADQMPAAVVKKLINTPSDSGELPLARTFCNKEAQNVLLKAGSKEVKIEAKDPTITNSRLTLTTVEVEEEEDDSAPDGGDA